MPKQLTSLQKISVSFLICFLFACNLTANPFHFAAGAREAGMGYSCIMNNTFWSSFNNQAGLALNNDFSAGINYEDRFRIKELGIKTAAIIIPAGNSSLGIVYSNHGYSDLRYQTAGIATGLKLSEKINAGVQIDYISEKSFGDYADNSFLTFEAGLLILPTKDIKVGIHLFNPVPNSLRKYYMPSEIRIGAGYNISQAIQINAELEKDTRNPVVLKTGFEYEPVSKLFLRGGFNSKNSTLCFGIGF